MPRQIHIAVPRAGHRVYALLGAALLALCAPAMAQDDKPGLFEVRSAEAVLYDGVYSLDARLQFILSTEALDALENGLPLNFVTDIEVIESRRFWIDDTIFANAIRYQLQYHALSQRYLVRNLISGDQESFATLYSALNNLGRLVDIPIIEEIQLSPERRYRFRIRSKLRFQDFSGPLRTIAFWLDEWHLRSEWFTWKLER